MGGQVPRRCRPHLRSCARLSAPSNRPATPKISPSSHLESSSNVRLPAMEPTIKPMTGPNKPRAITRPTRALIEPTKPLSHWPHRPLQLMMATSASLASSAWLYRPQEPRLPHWPHRPHRPRELRRDGCEVDPSAAFAALRRNQCLFPSGKHERFSYIKDEFIFHLVGMTNSSFSEMPLIISTIL